MKSAGFAGFYRWMRAPGCPKLEEQSVLFSFNPKEYS